ncbi:DNA-processing protein DprA [Idiomarina seosinensis]|uniref:DNA-processing protein DprA n=1 Tax=Idiomarina seosinensis TaxID=281739 RepID=UPI00384CFA29
MQQQDVCVLLALNRAKREIKRAARQLSCVEEVLQRWAQSLKPVDSRWVTAALDWQRNPNQGLVGFFDPAYPAHLKAIDDPPWLLFWQGRKELLESPKVAIIGSRKASHSGLQMADWLAKECSLHGITVVSGLAMGIDSQAHQRAVEQGLTIAVLGTGIDKVYPPRNRQLHRLIAHQGLLLSEFPPGIAARMDHFPRRNRIINGLSTGVVVVEAAPRSGSLSTALAAINEGRNVGAVPGNVFATEAQGCHWLLKQGAELISHPDDVLNWFAMTTNKLSVTDQPATEESLANSALSANVGFQPTTIEQLVMATGLSAAEVTEQLLFLELQGLVKAVAGGYIKVGRR